MPFRADLSQGAPHPVFLLNPQCCPHTSHSSAFSTMTLPPMFVAISGLQALIFAPTELLAKQHYRTLVDLVDSLPLRPHRPRVALLVGSTPKAEKDATKAAIAWGHTTILISTQAALWVKDWHKLALVVVDEQHK